MRSLTVIRLSERPKNADSCNFCNELVTFDRKVACKRFVERNFDRAPRLYLAGGFPINQMHGLARADRGLLPR